ncbi:MAG TPA: rhomboid family intramembrane serine protease [Thermodesulfobacteriota bacterium]|nr:rhomboid family intramembrane serine protease [Thermodesulfobacteriota bacterium]
MTRSPGFPYINIALIITNAIIFLYSYSIGDYMDLFVLRYGLIPAKVIASAPDIGLADRVYPFFSSMFLHGGWLHLIGNMLFLYIFGDNVEGRMGHFRYLVFYIVCGLIAALFQFVTNVHSAIPMVGASGAISGVLGAYMTFYPRSRILTLVPVFFFIQLIQIPAAVFIFVWFIIQFLSGLGTLSAPKESGGIAFWAHIGGFVAGLLLARFFDRKPYMREASTAGYYH